MQGTEIRAARRGRCGRGRDFARRGVFGIGDNQRRPAEHGADGQTTFTIRPCSDFPLKTGYSVQFFVKAYNKGDDRSRVSPARDLSRSERKPSGINVIRT